MTRADVDRWLERYVGAWQSNDRSEITALFSESIRYRYHPSDEPIAGPEAVADSWLEEPDAPGSFSASYEC